MPAFNRLTNVRIGPILRRVRNLPIRNAHTYPYDSAGYQNELCALIRRRPQYTDGLEDVWAGYNEGCFSAVEYM